MFQNYFTIPNLISSIRLFLSLPLIILIFNNKFISAAILVFVSFISDILDGFLARELKMQSFIGAFLDAFADKIFIFLVSFSLLYINKFPLWLFLIIFSRDLGITIGWLILFFSKKDKNITPRLLGKTTLFVQMFVIISALLNLRYLEVIYTICAVFTIASALDYLIKLDRLSLIFKEEGKKGITS